MTLHLLPTQKDWAASPETVFSGEVEWLRGCPLGKYEVHYQTKLKGIGYRMERLPIRPLEFGGSKHEVLWDSKCFSRVAVFGVLTLPLFVRFLRFSCNSTPDQAIMLIRRPLFKCSTMNNNIANNAE